MRTQRDGTSIKKSAQALYGLAVLLLLIVSSAAFSQHHPANHARQASSSAAPGGAASRTEHASTPELARAGFERFKKLEGSWKGRSTKGWEETITFKTIAQGSVVVENSFDAHPNETMLTMFYLDGDRLMLTHYCVAKNQPRLLATSFADEGKTITFTFLDGTNLPTRDRGHMDKAVFRFIDDTQFTSQWTWYQNGKEDWMEEIRLDRLQAGTASAAPKADGTNAEGPISIRTYGVKINVDNMDKALAFYCDKLGFEVEDRRQYPQQVFLKTGDRVKLILNAVKKLRQSSPEDTKVSLTLQVNDLDQAITRMRSLGVEFVEREKRTEGVGFAISIRDPFGRSVSLMHQTIAKVEPFKEPKLYNFGYGIPDMDRARDFYCNKLGFVARSEKYLPLDLPLGHQDKTFAFMLHYRPGIKPITSGTPDAAPFNMIVYETDDLEKAVAALKKSGVKILRDRPQKSAVGDVVVFEDPFGNLSELVSAR
jgi:catechol 2,3-dioxygenase-like lactoylglutathione lyase family enzyme